MSKLTHLGTCRMMKASTLGAILKLNSKSKVGAILQCMKK